MLVGVRLCCTLKIVICAPLPTTARLFGLSRVTAPLSAFSVNCRWVSVPQMARLTIASGAIKTFAMLFISVSFLSVGWFTLFGFGCPLGRNYAPVRRTFGFVDQALEAPGI